MPNYQPYSPDQAELLPAHVKDVLGADHLCFLVHEMVESLDLSGFEAYLPDPDMAHELSTGKVMVRVGRMMVSDPSLLRLRQRLRTAEGRTWYKKRKALVEPVFGILKEQRGMRQFQRRGLSAVALEWTLAAIVHNLIRYHALRRSA